MGKTITEKILSRASGRNEVTKGEYIRVRSSRPTPLCTDLSARSVDMLEKLGISKVFDPGKIIMIMDHCGNSTFGNAAENSRRNREFAKLAGIPERNVVDLGNQGVGHIVAGERCWALPGTFYISGTDGHVTAIGGLGAFAMCLSYEEPAYVATGETWMKVPGSVRFNLSGNLEETAMARDIFEYILGKIGISGALFKVMEYAGSGLADISMDGRQSMCANALFTGALTAIVPPDQKTIEYVRSHTDEPFEPLTSDTDAEFDYEMDVDVSQIEPQVVMPNKREEVKPIEKVIGVELNRGLIGSCASGRIEDMRAAARILKNRKVKNGFRLNITAGSVGVYRQALKEGLIEIFLDAGVLVPAPACGMCFGAYTPLADGDVCIAAGTANYQGRMGSDNAQIYLANPLVVAASAVEGRIATPKKYM